MDKKTLIGTSDRETLDVEIPGKGTITVQALTRLEYLRAAKIETVEKQEQYLLSRAMVDPPMTPTDVGLWQRNAKQGEMVALMRLIEQLSGALGSESEVRAADSEDAKSVGDRPDTGV